MKTTFAFLAAAVLAATALATSEEMKSLAARQGELRKAFAQQMKDKDFAAAKVTADELMASAKGAEAPALAEGAVAGLVGHAFAKPVNARLIGEAKKYLAVAAEKQPGALDRALAKFALLGLEVKTGAEDDYGKNIAAMKAFVEGVDLPPYETVRFLFDTVWPSDYPLDLDYLALADKAAGTNEAARSAFYGDAGGGGYRKMLDAARSDSLDPAMSAEARLAFVERALADPRFTGVNGKAKFVTYKVETMVALGRLDDAEKFLLEGAAKTNAPLDEASWQMRLGDFYKSVSPRYYSQPNAELQAKAIAAYSRAAYDPKPPKNVCATLADLCISAGDYDGARKALEAIVADSRGTTNAATMVKFGNLAYAQEDYAAAAEFYGQVDSPDLETRGKAATSLYVLGRYDECLPHLEVLASQKNRNKYTRPYFAYCLQKLKEKSEK